MYWVYIAILHKGNYKNTHYKKECYKHTTWWLLRKLRSSRVCWVDSLVGGSLVITQGADFAAWKGGWQAATWCRWQAAAMSGNRKQVSNWAGFDCCMVCWKWGTSVLLWVVVGNKFLTVCRIQDCIESVVIVTCLLVVQLIPWLIFWFTLNTPYKLMGGRTMSLFLRKQNHATVCPLVKMSATWSSVDRWWS